MTREFSKEKREIVFKKFNGRCAYCGCVLDKNKFHIDHIEAKYRGSTNEELLRYKKQKGLDLIDNLNPSCISCNCSKSTFTIDKWRVELSLKLDRTRRDVSSFRIMERFGMIKVCNTEVEFYFEKFIN